MSQETLEDENGLSAYLTGNLTQERLKELLHYDSSTGIFTWLNPVGYRVKAGAVAGWEYDGYIRIRVGGITYRAHVLAWFYVYGVWSMVDHKDRVRVHNWIDNLRESTRAQNSANQGVRITNLLGVKGVQKRGHKYRAYITVNYNTLHLGTYETIEEAIAARTQAAKKYFGEFANG